MSRAATYLGRMIAGALVLATFNVAAKEPSAREILERIDDLYRSKSSSGTMVMTVVTRQWSRELKLEAWSLGDEKSLVRILSPLKERGTATLKVEKDIWNYLPKVKRVIKVPSSMMGGSWMGSHFTNDDLVRESRMSEDFDFAFVQPERNDELLIEARPKPDAPVVWGKLLVRVRKSDWMPLDTRYFDEDMKLARTMTFSDYRQMANRLLPARMTMQPADKPGERTEIRYEKLELDLELDEGLFSLRSLQR